MGEQNLTYPLIGNEIIFTRWVIYRLLLEELVNSFYDKPFLKLSIMFPKNHCNLIISSAWKCFVL